jgi:hypothetical protein
MYFKITQDDYLTEWEVMKLRNVFWERWLQSTLIPLGLAALAYRYNNRLFGIYIERPTFYRPWRLWSSLCIGSIVWLLLNTIPWPSR